MNEFLTTPQQILLRRCEAGLRLHETGAARIAVLGDLVVLCQLRLVSSDPIRGYELTPRGESRLARLDSDC